MCNEGLGSEVVLEGDCFDIFLDAAADLAVAPGIGACEVGGDVCEEGFDLVETGLVFLRDFGRDGLVGGADALKGEDAEGCISCCQLKMKDKGILHLLAQRGDVPAGLDDALAAVVVLVQLVAEGFEDRQSRTSRLGGIHA